MRPRLRSFELSWTDATFEAICSDSKPRTVDPSEVRRAVDRVHPARFFDDLLAGVPFEQSIGLRLALWVVALSPLFTLAKFKTIAALSPRDRERAIERLLSSSIYVVRQLAISIKAIATLLAIARPPEPVDRAASPPSSGRASALVSLRRKPRAAGGGGGEEGPHDHAAE